MKILSILCLITAVFWSAVIKEAQANQLADDVENFIASIKDEIKNHREAAELIEYKIKLERPKYLSRKEKFLAGYIENTDKKTVWNLSTHDLAIDQKPVDDSIVWKATVLSNDLHMDHIVKEDNKVWPPLPNVFPVDSELNIVMDKSGGFKSYGAKLKPDDETDLNQKLVNNASSINNLYLLAGSEFVNSEVKLGDQIYPHPTDLAVELILEVEQSNLAGTLIGTVPCNQARCLFVEFSQRVESEMEGISVISQINGFVLLEESTFIQLRMGMIFNEYLTTADGYQSMKGALLQSVEE